VVEAALDFSDWTSVGHTICQYGFAGANVTIVQTGLLNGGGHVMPIEHDTSPTVEFEHVNGAMSTVGQRFGTQAGSSYW